MLKVDKSLLVKALEVTGLSVPKSNHLESLVKITAIDKSIAFTTTNTDITTFYKIDNVDIVKSFEVCVPHADLKHFVSKLQGANVVMRLIYNKEQDTMSLYLKSDYTKTLILGRPAEIFPCKGIIKNDAKYTSIKADVLLKMINKTITSVCTDEARWYINGILCDIQNNTLSCVATDSHRLTIAKTTLSNKTDDAKFILPRKSLSAIQAFLVNYGNLDIDIYYNTKPKQVVFHCDNYAIATCLVDGEFPDYKRVIPSFTNNSVVCNAKHLISAINQASGSHTNAIEINVIAGELDNGLQSKIELITKRRNANEITKATTLKTKTQIKCVASKNIKAVYNFVYLIGSLNACGSEEVNLCFTDPSKALKIIPVAKENQEVVIDTLAIVMPIRI